MIFFYFNAPAYCAKDCIDYSKLRERPPYSLEFVPFFSCENGDEENGGRYGLKIDFR